VHKGGAMDDPIYKPLTWVIFKLGEAHYFGQIVGGSYHKDHWSYLINNPQATVYMISESDILHEIDLDT
jgi:hypothetical protein